MIISCRPAAAASILVLAILAACATQPAPTASLPTAEPVETTTPGTITQTPAETSHPARATTSAASPTPEPGPDLPGFTSMDFPGAESVSVTAAGEAVYLLFGRSETLYLSRLEAGSPAFPNPVRVNRGVQAYVLPIERPALAANTQGEVGVAWIEAAEDHSSTTVWYAASTNGGSSFGPGKQVLVEENGMAIMVRVGLDAEGNPALAWLRHTNLRFARSFDQGATFPIVTSIGDGACDCCQPDPLVRGEQVSIAYRNVEPGDEKATIRDIVLIQSNDGGQTFEPVSPISAEHWYLEACPIAGPSLAEHDGQLFVTWMDGRNETPGTFSRGDIWFATSRDGGLTFSPNVRVNQDTSFHHTLPVVAAGPDGSIHLAWEAQDLTRDRLYYSVSSDGETFAEPLVIAAGADAARGRPNKPALVVDEQGRVYLAWLDNQGARLVSWLPPEE